MKVVFIKENSPEVRKKLEDVGFSICICATCKDSIWLTYYPDSMYPFDIHGVGYIDETLGMQELSPLERINVMLSLGNWFAKEKEFFDTVEDFLSKYSVK